MVGKAAASRGRFPWRGLGVLGMLAGSAFLNAMLLRYARRYFTESQQVRLDPEGLWDYPDPPPPRVRSTPRLVLFGDSRAAMWITDGLPAAEILNRGIGSQTTRQILSRLDPHLLSLKPDIVIVQAGINDLKNIGLFPSRSDQIVADCFANLSEIVERASRGAFVVLTTIFPHGPIEPQRRPFWTPAIAQAVLSVNRALSTLEGPRCRVFDAWALLEQSNRVAPKYQLDALHINEVGYRALNRAIAPLIQEILASQQRRTRNTANMEPAEVIGS